MNDKEEILAALKSLGTEQATQQVKLQRTVDRIANEQVEMRHELGEVKSRVSVLEGARKYSDRARAGLSDADMRHESDMGAVVVALDATRAKVADIEGQQHALMAMNQKQTGMLALIRSTPVKRFLSDSAKLVSALAAVAAAYLAAKGHK